MSATYWLTWNPKKWEWADLGEMIAEVHESGSADSWWSYGNVRNMPDGSRFYMIRVAADPKGIVGLGGHHKEPVRKASLG